MYTVAFNIVVEHNQKMVALNTTPYLLVNVRLFNILYEIRRIIAANFRAYARELGVPLHAFHLHLAVFETQANRYHHFQVTGKKVRELQILMREEYPPEVYQKIMAEA